MTTEERLTVLEAEVTQLRADTAEHHEVLYRLLRSLDKLAVSITKEISSGATLMKAVFALARHTHTEQPMKGKT